MAKLVRDKIPELVRKNNPERRLSLWQDQDKARWLGLKLQEEVQEFLTEPCVEELADILEVLLALAELHGCSADELENARASKAAVRGKFKEGWILHDD